MPTIAVSRHRRRRVMMLAAGVLLPAIASCRRPSAAAAPPTSPAAARSSAAPAHGEARTEAAAAHLLLTGSYAVDHAVLALCAVQPNHDLQVSFQNGPLPQVVLLLKGFHGAGSYTAETRIRASYTGETSLQSKGAARALLTVEPVSRPRPGVLISGRFEGTYFGEAGRGGVAASFERCFSGGSAGG
jgi:hypothetical protein